MHKTVVIIGGGPAGLTAAYELCRRKYRPIVLEKDSQLGGISKTIEHRGNRMDLGGHRFFSKSDWVMDWWLEHLPLQNVPGKSPIEIQYQNQRRLWTAAPIATPRNDSETMLVRERKSRILFDGKFFDYPLSLSLGTLRNLGWLRCCYFLGSYLSVQLRPRREATNLEDFFIARFGAALYRTFFQSYTEKVWGKPCKEISAEWGAQRIKGLSIFKAVWSALRRQMGFTSKKEETSLIERFLYPRLGPGQLWETVGKKVQALGGEIHLQSQVDRLEYSDGKILAVWSTDCATGASRRIECDSVISSMPIPELLKSFDQGVPAAVMEVAQTLSFREFVTVGVLLKKLSNKFEKVEDTWLYIQDPKVKVGRIQFFHRWSPDLVADASTAWLGLEYFCEQGDALWNQSEAAWLQLIREEIALLGLADPSDILDTKLVKVPKAYPAYWGGYEKFSVIRDFVDPIENLYLVGRNGMHRYNNQDHSMLTALRAVQAIESGSSDKTAIWEVNTEPEYHEEKTPRPLQSGPQPEPQLTPQEGPPPGRPMVESA